VLLINTQSNISHADKIKVQKIINCSYKWLTKLTKQHRL